MAIIDDLAAARHEARWWLAIAGLSMMLAGLSRIAVTTTRVTKPQPASIDPAQIVGVVVITNSEITYQGQLIATTDSVLLGEQPPDGTIDALHERLEAAFLNRPHYLFEREEQEREACTEWYLDRRAVREGRAVDPTPKRACRRRLLVVEVADTTVAFATSSRTGGDVLRVIRTAHRIGCDVVLSSRPLLILRAPQLVGR